MPIGPRNRPKFSKFLVVQYFGSRHDGDFEHAHERWHGISPHHRILPLSYYFCPIFELTPTVLSAAILVSAFQFCLFSVSSSTWCHHLARHAGIIAAPYPNCTDCCRVFRALFRQREHLTIAIVFRLSFQIFFSPMGGIIRYGHTCRYFILYVCQRAIYFYFVVWGCCRAHLSRSAASRMFVATFSVDPAFGSEDYVALSNGSGLAEPVRVFMKLCLLKNLTNARVILCSRRPFLRPKITVFVACKRM